jgi:hypothetical protein
MTNGVLGIVYHLDCEEPVILNKKQQFWYYV